MRCRTRNSDRLCAGLVVNWTGESCQVWEERLRQAGAVRVQTLLRQSGIPARLADAIAAGLRDKQAAQLKKGELQGLVARLVANPLPVSGHEGYPKVSCCLLVAACCYCQDPHVEAASDQKQYS